MDATARFYSQPSYVGGGFPVFAGSRRQRGGGIFGSLAKMVLPALKSVGSSVLRNVGREAVGLARDVADTALSGQGLSGIRQTLQQQGLKRLRSVGRDALATTLNQFQPQAPPVANPAAPLGKRRRVATTAPTKRRPKRAQRRGGSTATAANF